MVEPKDSGQITKSKIDEAIKALKEQKPKEREDISDREAIRKMRRYIEKLTSNKYGYSYDEVSEMLKGLGINLTGSRIKYLIGELKKNTHRRQKTDSSGNSSTLSNPATETQLTVGNTAIENTAIETESPVENTASVQASSEPEKLTVNSAKGKRKNKQPFSQEQSAQSNLEGELNNAAFQPKLYNAEDL
ncbi:hypothetical protein [Nostoc sp. 'Peltigera membranacea cyanobiont' 232]|uniref:hypothetical protein n=1 Tax=Nostoc sp. 'Peltigera membranacea cyanobiont' 232 TaxID=2014531 RepID=UPI000B95582C|nr:hypothetical protein [Nostoc sp. 'Peltigera membranacea cyanobiont' 232]OYE03095.1 hypothetical protein CDG79_20455 [Nostoc sp. 'Peltigera membranacea cyanobiont' 232]